MEKIHTTEMGKDRIRKNLLLDDNEDVVSWCKNAISDEQCKAERKGKNYYATIGDTEITINSYSFTIITAHKNK